MFMRRTATTEPRASVAGRGLAQLHLRVRVRVNSNVLTLPLPLPLTLTRYSSDEGSQEGSCDEGEGEVLSPELRIYCLVEAEGPTKVLTRSLPLTLPLPLPDYSMPLPPMLTQAHQC